MKKWRYRTTDNEVLGIGYLPNGFSTNELDPESPDVVQEDIPESCNPDLILYVITRTGVGTYTQAER